MECYGISDIGLIRKVNQDCFAISTNENGALLVVVCDGIGGGKAGDIAAKMTCTYLEQAFQEATQFQDDVKISAWIQKTLQQANTMVFQKAKSNVDFQGMGTTVVGFLKINNDTFIFHAGDSRIYGLYEEFVLLTKDHNVKEELLESNTLSVQEIEVHPHRNLLTNAIGIWEQNKIEIRKIRSNYQFLLVCSDGLHGLVEQDQMEKIITSDQDIQTKAKLLVESAKYHGGNDNITVVLAQV